MGNRYCTPGFPGDLWPPLNHKSLIIKRLQRIPGNQGCHMPHRFREGVGASSCGFRWGRYTVSVARREHIVPIPLLVEGSGRPKHTDSSAEKGEKVYIVYRFRGHEGNRESKGIQIPPRFPRLRGCTRPIVNSRVKFFPWGTGEGVPFWACQAKSTCGRSTGGIYFWSVSALSGLPSISAKSSKIDTGPFHGGRIDLEGGHTFWVGSCSGGELAARSR